MVPIILTVLAVVSCKTHEHVSTSQGMAKLDFDFEVEPARIDTSSMELTIEQICMLPVGAEYSIPTASGGRAMLKNTGSGIRLTAENIKNEHVKMNGNAVTQNSVREVHPQDDNEQICLISGFIVFILVAVIIYYMKNKQKG